MTRRMKRSQINHILDDFESKLLRTVPGFIPRHFFYTTDQWRKEPDLLKACRDAGLGWDVTDFGSGDFEKTGLALVTTTNYRAPLTSVGYHAQVPTGFCQKFMLSRAGQVTPNHSHSKKREEITVIAGNPLKMMLSAKDRGNVRVILGSKTQGFPSGTMISLEAGATVRLVPGVFHVFWSQDGDGDGYTLLHEVSTPNDDVGDNIFDPEIPRFPDIEEDEPMRYPLCTDYDRILEELRSA